MTNSLEYPLDGSTSHVICLQYVGGIIASLSCKMKEQSNSAVNESRNYVYQFTRPYSIFY